MAFDHYQHYLQQRQEAGLQRHLRWLEPAPAGRIARDGRTLLNLSGNDYLGLARHPLLLQRACQWGERWGTGAAASRLVTGNLDAFRMIEERLAHSHGTATALIFNSGFQANAGVLPSLLDRQVLENTPLVFADRLVHASIHQGCQVAGVRQIRFRHNDMNHLEHLLQAHSHLPGQRFILTESLFSMEGDCAPLADLIALKERFGAFLYLDEAHAVGVMGPEGRGFSAAFAGQIDLVVATFGKALGASGAYVACSQPLAHYLINHAAAFTYSTGLSPLVLGAVDGALDLLPTLEEARRRLLANSQWLRQGLRQGGWDTAASSSQIVPLLTRNPHRAVALSRQLEEEGFLGVAIRPPTVPTSRIRFSLSAVHHQEELAPMLAFLLAWEPPEENTL